MSDLSFTYVTYIATTPEILWKALTTSEYTERYFFGTSIKSDWQEGGEIAYSRNGEVTDYGKILKVEPHSVLSFTWTYVDDRNERDGASIVTFTLKQLDSAVRLTLNHENLVPSDLSDEDDTFQGLNNGWPAILSNLKTLLETGDTLPAVSI